MKRIQPYPVALALSFVFLIFYVVCIVLHSILPANHWEMYRIWEMVMPGFTWLTSLSFVLGILEMFLGGFYVAYILIPLYNLFNKQLFNKKGNYAMNRLRFQPVALAVTSFGLITYVLCILFDLVFTQWAMYRFWEILLPGFTWISWGSFFIGLIGVIVYGVYAAAVFVPIYNYFQRDGIMEI